ncbi:serine hydrolase domain-containing protein [Arthrobacter glacialis]|uniref:D-alanyl-D-alanine carboxypeptidase n=1 Tax=Arthrobacter glacialis TaxID=1664 RepID=A0A2S3ZWI0_ARTGL|nr:serine hydrolase [Arthrobacter glacialis]POH73578.1 D-alanyl-D-alanine carboxypeptidase [Arthrobacter glacialis]
MSEYPESPSAARRPMILTAILALVLTGCTGAPPAPEQSSAAVVRYKTDLEDFSRNLLDLGAGAVLIEARINGDVWSHAVGVRSVGSPDPAEVTDPTHIASVTKSMVAVSVLKLVEEGLVQFKDPVAKHLPEFDSLVKPPGPVTVEHLLRHESGLPSYEQALYTSRPMRQALTQSISAAEGLALATTMPWVLAPGSGSDYSNSNYLVLGLLLERLRGQPVAEILRNDVFEPLGMVSTHLMSTGTVPPTMVHGHVVVDGERLDSAYFGGMMGNAAGGVVSTVADVNTFYAALLGGQLLKPATVREMQQAPFGMGLMRWVDVCGGFYYGHGGEGAGYRTMALNSADGAGQVTIAITHPPESWDPADFDPVNPFGGEALMRAARTALDLSC